MIVLALCAELVLVLFPVIGVPTKHPRVVKLLGESSESKLKFEVTLTYGRRAWAIRNV